MRFLRRSSAVTVALVTLTGLASTGPVGAQTTSTGASSTSSSSSTSTSTTTSTTSTTTTTTTTTTTRPPTTAATTVASTTTTVPATTFPERVAGAPLNVAAALTGTAQITVSWQPPTPNGGPPITGYSVVEVSIVGTSSSTAAPVAVGNVTSRVFNDRRPGVSYAYYVRATNASGEGVNSPYTAPILVPGPTTTLSPAPASPQNPTLTYLGNGQLRISWTPPPTSPSVVVAYRITTTPSLGSWKVASSNLSVTIKGARAGVAYVAQIASVNPQGVQSALAVTNPVNIPVPTTVPLPATSAPPPPQGKPLPVQPRTPPGKPKPCVRTSWPQYVYGRPAIFTTGAPQGVYVWHDGKYWQVRFYNPGPGPVVFTGSIAANTRVTFWGSGNDRGDVLRRGRSSATFSLTSDYDIDGIRISASCATALTFDFKVNGVPVNPGRIYIGKGSTAPGATFSLTR